MNSTPGSALTVIIVTWNSEPWISACLESLTRHADGVAFEVIVVDSGSTDGTVELIEERFPWVWTIRSENRGFAHANNLGLARGRSPFVLFLNPDTQIASGSLREVLEAFAERPSLGVLGVRQVDGEGELQFSMRRFPSVARTFFESLGSESFPMRWSWLGERILDPQVYEREERCDWTSGSFLLARREAIDAAGAMDERFFLYAEEPDLCLRIVRSGWEVRHLPRMTIVHYGGSTGDDPKLEAQAALSRRLYMRKHYGPVRYVIGTCALAFGYALRGVLGGKDVEHRAAKRHASRRAFLTTLGLAPPPFGEPPSPSSSLR